MSLWSAPSEKSSSRLSVSWVFISHVHEDAAKITQLADELNARGATVWLDRKDLTVGDDWRSEIRRAIENGLFFVACFSENYLSRERTYMNVEVDLAVEELAMRRPGRRWFLPVVLDPIDVSVLWIGRWERLSGIQHLRMHDDWDAAVDQLVAVIEPPAAASVREARLREIDPPPAVVVGGSTVRPAREIVRPRARWRVQDTQQQAERAQPSRITSLAFDPRGGLLASCGAEEHAVRLWGVPDLNELDVAPTHEERVSRLAFDPGGESLATAGDDLAVRVWRVETGEQRWRLPHPKQDPVLGHFYPMLAFNTSGSLLAAATLTGRLHVWDLTSGQELERLPEVRHVRDLAFAPFDRVVATAEADGVARLRDVDTGRVLLEKPSGVRGFLVHSTPMEHVRVSADGHLFATVTEDGECQVWQTKTGREIRELRRSNISHIAFSPERRLMAATLADDTMRAWELDGGREVLCVEHPSNVLKLLFRPDGAMLATVGEDWLARLVDVDEPGEPRVLEHRALDLAFSPDSRMVATGADAIVLWGPDPS
jgi:hypothetical protein